MVTLHCVRCAGTCQIPPRHEGRLHTCEHCGLVLTVPGKPRPLARQAKARRLGMFETLVGAGALISLVAAVLAILVVSNRPSRATREAVRTDVDAERSATASVQPAAAPAAAVRPPAKPEASQPAPSQAVAAANRGVPAAPVAAAKVSHAPVTEIQIEDSPAPARPAQTLPEPVIVTEEPAPTVVIAAPAPVPAKVLPAFSPVQPDGSRSSEIAAVIASTTAAGSNEGLPIANFSFEAQPADYTDQVTGWSHDSDSHLAQRICQTPQKRNLHGQKYLELYHDVGQKPADGVCAIRTAQPVGIYKPGMRYTLKVLLSRNGEAQAQRSVVIALSTPSGKVVSRTIALTQIPESEFAEFATILDTSTNRQCIGQDIYPTIEFIARRGQWGRALDIDDVRVRADPVARR